MTCASFTNVRRGVRRLCAVAIAATSLSTVAAAQSTLSQNSGINAGDTWAVFDVTVHNQATLHLSQPLQSTGATAVPVNVADRHFHVEAGFDAGNRLVLNLFVTDPPADPTTSLVSQIGKLQVVNGQPTVYDTSGNPLPGAFPHGSAASAWPFGATPGASVLDYLLCSDLSQLASEMQGTVQSVQSSPPISKVTAPLHTSGGGSIALTYQSGGSVWTLQQVTLTPAMSQLQATWTVQIANLAWNRNSSGDAARASLATSPPPPPASAGAAFSFNSTQASTSCVPVATGPGLGQNVVFQHGIFSCSDTWQRMDPWLSADFEFGEKVIPSIGATNSLGIHGADRLATQGSQLIGVLDGTGQNDFVFIGHSQGGLISRDVAQRRPDLGLGVVTVDSPHQGALLVANGAQDLANELADGIDALAEAAGCTSPDDNVGCAIADFLASQSFPIVNFGLNSAVPATTDLLPGSNYVTNLNANPESFTRVGIESHSNKRWVLMRLGGDLFSNPDDTFGGRNIALATEVAYDVLRGCEALAIIEGDYETAAFCGGIADVMDAIDSFWDDVTTNGDGPSDGVVTGASQHYPGATASYVIGGADSHVGAPRSDKVRDRLIQTLDAQFFVPRAGCSFTLSPASAAFVSPGGTGTISIATGPSCSWSAASNAPWVSITSARQGVSNGSVTFNVAATASTSARTGTLSISGLLVTITQDGVPVLTSLSAGAGAVGASITITGSGFGAAQGSSTVTFGGAAAAVSSWSDTRIVATVPAAATTGGVVVTVGGVASNAISFTVLPGIASLAPAFGPVGTSVTVTGTDFGATQGGSTVTFNGTPATASSWSAGTLVVSVPGGLPPGVASVVVTVNGLASSGVPFTVTPGIGSLSPASGPVGTPVTVAGTGFGAAQGSSTVTFNGTPAAVSSWSNLAVVVTVPGSIPAGAASVVVTVNGIASNAAAFTVLPGIAGINPPGGPTGACVTIAGTDFGATQGASTVTFGGVPATVNSWTNTSVVACVPAGLAAGSVPVVIAVNGAASAAASFTVTPAITAVSPGSGVVGTAVTLTGTSFGASQGSSTVTFNGAAAAAGTWSNTSLAVTVPAAATSGSLVVTVNGVASNAVAFTVTPTVTGLSPGSGPVGAAVTVQGNNFGAAQGASTVTFNGIAAAASSWSATSLAVAVPGGLGAGAASVVVTVGGAGSNAAAFNVTPVVAGLSPGFGPVGTLVTINGTSFGTSQGSGTVAFNGLAATVGSWSNASVVAAVPAGATTGNVAVTAAGLPSNGARFVVTAPSVFDLTATASSTSGLMQLSSTLGGAASFPSPNLANQPAGDYLIQAFDTQAGVPNSTNSWPAGLNATFVVWMQQTAGTAGTLFPEVALYLNGPTGTPICSAVGSTALGATNTQFNLSCAPAATVNLAAGDRWYLRVGVHSTAASSSALQAQTGVGTQVRGRPAASVTVPIQ